MSTLRKKHTAYAHAAVEALLLAYARNDSGEDSINWFYLDAAFALAKRALPGRYRELVKELAHSETIEQGGLA